jgi:iron complex outermembrane receptor protein
VNLQRKPLAVSIALALSLHLAGATSLFLLPGAAHAQADDRVFSIPAGSLDEALAQLATQAGIPVASDAALTRGKTSAGVSGRMSAAAALDVVLAGSGLQARRTANGWVVTGEIASSTVASNQSAPDTLGEVRVRGRGLDERTTVQRRSSGTALFGETDTRELPFAISIVGEQEIRNRQAINASEALLTDPAVSNGFGASGDMPFESFQIRGFDVRNAIYDGIPYEYYSSRGTQTLERIEVLRGTAAFRYGFLAPGGALNYVSKKPTEADLRRLILSTNSNGLLGAHIDLGGRMGIDRRLGYRLNIAGSVDPTYAPDTRQNRLVFALATDYRLTPDTTLSASIEQADFRGRGPGQTGYRVANLFGGNLPSPVPDPKTQWLPQWDYGDVREQLATARVNTKLTKDWTFDTALAYLNKREEVFGGSAFNPYAANGDLTLDLYGYIWKPRTISVISQIYGKVDTGPITHNISAGVLYWNKRDQSFISTNNFTNPIASNFFARANLPQVSPDWALDTIYEETQRGAFISNKMDIGRFHPLLGLRYASIRTDPNKYAPDAQGNSKVTPVVGLMVDITPQVGVYASYAQGLESGGRAPIGAANANQQMAPLESRGIEVGIKADILYGRATFDASIFDIEKTSAFLGAGNLFVQQGKQTHRGMEALLRGRLTQALELSAGFQIIDAEYSGDPGRDGQRVPGVPRLRFVANADYRLAMVPGLFVTGLVNHVGRQEVTVPNTIQYSGYTRLDSGVRYETRWAGTRTVVRLNITNLLNERFFTQVAAPTFAFPSLNFGAPRTVRASVEFQL